VSGKSCQTLGATTPKALAHVAAFGAALTDQVAGSRTNSSARNVVGCSEDMVVILWNENNNFQKTQVYTFVYTGLFW